LHVRTCKTDTGNRGRLAPLGDVRCVDVVPPLIVEPKPKASFRSPPMTEERNPMALLLTPALIEEFLPKAAFPPPPLTEE